MKSSFQFPNGENFTPRNRYMTKSSSATQLATPAMQKQPPLQLPPSRAQTLKGFRVGGDLTMGGMPRSQSLTSLSHPPRNTLLRNSPIGLRSSMSPLVNSNSTETVLSSSGSNQSTRNSARDSSSSVQSRPTTVSTSDKEVAPLSKPLLPPIEPAGSPQGSLDSANDDDFQSARASLIEEEQESPQLEPGSPLQVGLEPEEIGDEQLDDESSTTQDEISVQAREPEAQQEREPLGKQELHETSIEKPDTQQLPSLSSSNGNVSKRTKFGRFFRRIFHHSTPNGLRKRKRTQTPSSSGSGSPVIAPPPPKTRHREVSVTDGGSPISNKKGSSVQKVPSNPRKQKRKQKTRHSHNDSKTNPNDTIDKSRQSSLTPSLEAEEDVLMDTDLVFDSLLLKADSNRPSAWNRQRDLQLKLQTLASPEQSPTDGKEREPLVKEETDDNDSNVDYELIQEFSKLGSYIEGPSNGIEPDKNPKILEDQATTHIPRSNSPPQRSPRRPSLPSKDLAQSFYCH